MKKIVFLLAILFSGCESSEIIPSQFYDCIQTNQLTVSSAEAASYQAHIDHLVSRGVPGIMLTIDHPQKGFWTGASGQADIASQVPMKSCNISRAGSTVKTFTATSILLLVEDGKLSLEDKARDYLPAAMVKKLKNADQATVRQLLNHTSGIYNYIQDPKFQTASLNDLARVWQPEDLLSYAYGRDAYFAAGTGCQYSNTNYILLGLIIEKVSGLHFSLFLKREFLTLLGWHSPHLMLMTQYPKDLPEGT